MPEPCGALVVTRWLEGNEAEIRWCERLDGPCPFPGADQAQRSERLCGASPTKRLRVSWAPTAVDDALLRLIAIRDRTVGDEIRPNEQALMVAIDALRSCGAGEEDL